VKITGMKRFTLVGFIVSLLVFLGAIYVQFVVVPNSESAEMQMMLHDAGFLRGTHSYNTLEYSALFETYEAKVIYGMYLTIAAIAAFLLVVYPATKKQGLAILGVILSLVSCFIGTVHGTHLFS
jgi:hypothetical protein